MAYADPMMFTARATGARHARRARTGALAAVLLSLLLAGCGNDAAGGGSDDGGKDGKDRDDAASQAPPKPAPVVTPGPSSAPVPEGKGSALPDDINGDGYPDLQMQVPELRSTYVLGSKKGLLPDTRIVTAAQQGGGSSTSVPSADLDGDGYPETLGLRSDDTEVKGPGGVIHASRSLGYITWGSAKGPRSGAEATQLGLPEGKSAQGLSDTKPAVGDFDGDGRADVAAVGIEGAELFLMYGPFSRSGEPSRTDIRTADTGGWGELVTDRIHAEDERPTGLLIRRGDDGEQARNFLFEAGPDGLPEQGREVRAGSASVFGDFDGDGKRDVAVGDNGSRNNEPGHGTEKSDVAESVDIYYSGPAAERQHLRIPGIQGGLVAADTNGDGRSELAVNRGTAESGRLTSAELLTLSRTKIEKRVSLTRTVPDRVDGRKVAKSDRVALAVDAADFDGDGNEEVVLNWHAEPFSNSPDDKHRGRWWITTGSKDLLAFTSRSYAGPAPEGATPMPF